MQSIDEKMNYKEFYSKHLKQITISGGKIKSLCPFHNENDPSFSVDLKTGKYNCFSCGEKGNATTFLSKIEKITTKEADKKLKELAGIKTGLKSKSNNDNHFYSLENYAQEKKLSINLLEKAGIKTVRANKISYVSIPYLNKEGEIVATRKRFDPRNKKRFAWTRNAKLILYGLWFLNNLDDKNFKELVLVEGESDCHALWENSIVALGVPGANNFKKEWISDLEKFEKIYIHHEGDQGADRFIESVCCELPASFQDKLYKIQCRTVNVKDPSELHIKHQEDFKDQWEKVIENSSKINLKEYGSNSEKAEYFLIDTNAPVRGLETPSGWRLTERGIHYLGKDGYELVSSTPIIISKVIKNLDENKEKVELSYYKNNKWNSIKTYRSTISQSRKLPELSDTGIQITSENSKKLVRYFMELENKNMNKIPYKKAISRLGWFGNSFMPFESDEVELDFGEGASDKWLIGYESNGTLKEWISHIRKYRENKIFRFLLSASMATPLLKILKQRIFVVHLWGDSRSGKTAALKGLVSVWGEPETLLASFNATKVGLERMASFFNDLPLAIDEKQVLGKGSQGHIDSLVYMLSLGTSKLRGTKNGGLQAGKTWRTITFTTGEEPLTDYESQPGVYTRTLEIKGKPFESEKEASDMHRLCNNYYGVAGRKMIEILSSNLYTEEEMKELYEKLIEQLQEEFPKKLSSHISAVAAVTIADQIASLEIFDDDVTDSLELAREIMKKLTDIENTDIVTKGYDFIKEMLAANPSKFKKDCTIDRYGLVETDPFNNVTAYILPSVLRREFEKNKLPINKVIDGLVDREIIEKDKKGKNSIVKWIDGKSCRVYKIMIKSEIDSNT